MSKNIYHIFPGSNTSQGFYSFFQYILPNENAKKVIYIKGGPGTGKSSLMKKIGSIFNDKGYEIEFFHCSSDNESLDGVVIKGLNFALIDGTAPHINDPKVPGAMDGILNLGECLDEKNLSNYKEEIIKISSDISDSFKEAYSYLASAKSLHENLSYYNHNSLDIIKLNTIKQSLIKSIFKNPRIGSGNERHLFATAFTPNGIISYIDTLYVKCKNIYTLNGGAGTGKTNILNTIKNEAINSGYDVQIYHDPFIPDRLEHIIIPDLDTAVLTSNEINNRTFHGTQVYMSNIMDKRYLATKKDSIEKNTETFNSLVDEAIKHLNNCKKLHDELEKYYVSNIDFQKVDMLSENLISNLLSCEKK
ncbi:PRK06851 family protein [Clostridium rectalis]|uniref:PRK06851 family protein n=1 Tax=Clostridium rectalis TaxID=2040295 RepID=UPI000F644564|nr:PRK06851 family protein [Clostridium rectalis]